MDAQDSGVKFGGAARRLFALAGKPSGGGGGGYPTHDRVRANDGLQCAQPQPQRSVSAFYSYNFSLSICPLSFDSGRQEKVTSLLRLYLAIHDPHHVLEISCSSFEFAA